MNEFKISLFSRQDVVYKICGGFTTVNSITLSVTVSLDLPLYNDGFSSNRGLLLVSLRTET